MPYPYGTNITMSVAETAISLGWGYRLQFRISAEPFNTTQETLASGESAFISIRHSDKSVMLIGREIACNRPDVMYSVYANPTIASYGAPMEILPLNSERTNPSANTANIVAPADVTDMGNEVDFGVPVVGGNPNIGGSPYNADDFKINPSNQDFLLRS